MRDTDWLCLKIWYDLIIRVNLTLVGADCGEFLEWQIFFGDLVEDVEALRFMQHGLRAIQIRTPSRIRIILRIQDLNTRRATENISFDLPATKECVQTFGYFRTIPRNPPMLGFFVLICWTRPPRNGKKFQSKFIIMCPWRLLFLRGIIYRFPTKKNSSFSQNGFLLFLPMKNGFVRQYATHKTTDNSSFSDFSTLRLFIWRGVNTPCSDKSQYWWLQSPRHPHHLGPLQTHHLGPLHRIHTLPTLWRIT